MSAYAFEEFDIDNAVSPSVTHKSVKLMGVGKAISVLSSPSRSTEEMIAGAVSAIGAANRNVMFVHSSLNALDDRLRIAGKIAQSVNMAKQHGTEGFADVKYLNPWEYAIESKTGAFFTKIWQAIRTACRRVIEAIAYIIKWIGNAIAGADVKAHSDIILQTKDSHLIYYYAYFLLDILPKSCVLAHISTLEKIHPYYAKLLKYKYKEIENNNLKKVVVFEECANNMDEKINTLMKVRKLNKKNNN